MYTLTQFAGEARRVRCALASRAIPSALALLVSACSLDNPADPAPADVPDSVAKVSGELAGNAGGYRLPTHSRSARDLSALWLDKGAGRGDANHAVALEEGAMGSEDGSVQKLSGFVAHQRRLLSPAERMALGADEPAKQPRSPGKLGNVLRAEMQESADDALFDISVAVHHRHAEPIFSQVEDAVIAGELTTKEDVHHQREALKSDRRQTFAALRGPVVERMTALGAQDLKASESLPVVMATMSKAGITALAQHGGVRKIVRRVPIQPDHGSTLVRGAHQIDQFLDAGFNGGAANVAGVTSWDITFAQIEGAAADDEHVGFKENSGTATRIRTKYDCTASGVCSEVTSFWPEGDHPSAVAGIIFGDLRQGQDPAVADTAERLDRTGMAPEARGYMFKAEPQDRVGAFDTMDSLGTPQVHVANMSAGAGHGACDGDTDLDEAANLLFESGTLLIKSAGNQKHDTSACTTNVPAAAVGVFTVGGVGNTSLESSEASLRGAPVYTASSRGNSGGRTIVDLAASACRRLVFDSAGGYGGTGCGTSYATPTVTGAAIDFIDWYKTTYSNYIDNPGVLFANLLLMGDRQDEDGNKLSSRYDDVVGAGHLRARRFDSTGLDGPWGWSTGSVCVGNGEMITVDVSGGILSTDVDTFLATAYWYDARHGTTGELDNVDLYLYGSGAYMRGSTSLDNKERVFTSSPGGKDLELRFYGRDVTADSAGCGSNRMRVYFAYYWEDSDRESHEDLAGIDPA